MKKIAIVLLMALALVSIATAEVVITGEFDYGFMSDGDDYAGKFKKIELDLAVNIDDYNTFKLELEDDIQTDDIGNSSANINYAYILTDWSGLFELPVSLSTEVGYDDYGIGDNDITQYGFENWCVYTDKSGGGAVNLGFNDMVSVSAGLIFDPDTGSTGAGDHDGDANGDYDAAFNATVNYAPVKVNVGYSTVDDGYFYLQGDLGMEAGPGNLDALAQYHYDSLDETSGWGLGVNYGIDAAVIGVSYAGDEDDLGLLGLSLGYALNEIVGFDLGGSFYLDDDDTVSDDAFLGLDASVTIAASDAITYRVGYLYSDGHGVLANLNSKASLTDGGAYMAVEVNY